MRRRTSIFVGTSSNLGPGAGRHSGSSSSLERALTMLINGR